MPPSLPTGTVSQTSAGTRTFPPDSDTDRARAPATSPQPSRQPQARQSLPSSSHSSHSSPPPSSPSPSSVPSAVVSRREHDVALSREHDRVAELERENEALREYISLQVSDKQSVIERYERLLDQREDELRSQPAAEPPPSSPTPRSVREVADAIQSRVRAVGSRLVARVSLD